MKAYENARRNVQGEAAESGIVPGPAMFFGLTSIVQLGQHRGSRIRHLLSAYSQHESASLYEYMQTTLSIMYSWEDNWFPFAIRLSRTVFGYEGAEANISERAVEK